MFHELYGFEWVAVCVVLIYVVLWVCCVDLCFMGLLYGFESGCCVDLCCFMGLLCGVESGGCMCCVDLCCFMCLLCGVESGGCMLC